MPLQEKSLASQREEIVFRVVEGGQKVAHVAREFGVSRRMVYYWLRRNEESPQRGFASLPSRPRVSPARTPSEVESLLIAEKVCFPEWGAKKLMERLWPQGEGEAPICLRTADRILKRNGLVVPRKVEEEALERFERTRPNELWQVDFKGIPLDATYRPLSILDDHSRYCLRFAPLSSGTTETVFPVLWEVFLLGVQSIHGRPYHPQTQGKVERFHRTANLELGKQFLQPSAEAARSVYDAFVHRYNHERPHEAIDMRRPAQVFRPSERRCLPTLPVHEIASGVTKRNVDDYGKFGYRGDRYRAGKGFRDQWIVIADDEFGEVMKFAGYNLGYLSERKV